MKISLDNLVFGQRKELVPFKGFTAAFCCATFFIPLLYALWTNHVWEDFFITFKFSQNLAEGRGLVYQPGVRVHGFTSPLGTLLPALCHWIMGGKSYIEAIWLFRVIFCIPAYVLAGLYFLRTISLCRTVSSWNALLASFLFLLECKSLIFSVNGMETAFMLLFVLLTFYYTNAQSLSSEMSSLSSDEKKSRAVLYFKPQIMLGLCWGGLMWTRPDGFIFIVAIALSFYIMNPGRFRVANIRGIFISALVCAIIYLPWFLWSWSYYGSPVPNTVRAKGAFMAGLSFSDIFINSLQKAPHCLAWVFSPPYCHFAGWHEFFIYFCLFTGVFCISFWTLRRGDEILRRASLAFMFVCLYFIGMNFPYPWYFPPAAILAILVIAGLNLQYGSLDSKLSSLKLILLRAFQTCVVVVMLAMSVGTVVEMRIQQSLIETGNRRKIGEWLKKHMRSDESLFLECLGYIGYFSGAENIYDYPGLASPKVVEIIKSGKRRFEDVAAELEPDWIVVRPWEFNALLENGVAKMYSVAEVFDVRREIEDLRGFYPGKGYLLYDAVFIVLRRNERN